MGYATKAQSVTELDSGLPSGAKLQVSIDESKQRVYNRIVYLYIRDVSFNLLFDLTFPRLLEHNQKLEWSDIATQLQTLRTTLRSTLVDTTARYELKCSDNKDLALELFEKRRLKDRYIGICVLHSTRTVSEVDSLELPFISHLLGHVNIDTFCTSTFTTPISTSSNALESRISDLFSSRLRFSPKNDQWDATGERHFQQTISRYTSRGLPIEFVLPAFPCKSSSSEKVVGTSPDAGEHLAIRNLVDFCSAIGKIYDSGAILWIVSDGHVFSDCVGVDDDQVDKYNTALREMTCRIPGSECIKFISLRDLLGFYTDEITLASLSIVKHPIPTKLSAADENSRAILAATCQPSTEALRGSFENPDSGELRLYRGLSKFMLQDLALHPKMMALSKTKRKKLASRVAFEMVVRNQAYSNLVELFFPACVRLSIHAHPNCGPKFGINLMSKDLCRVVGDSALISDGDHHIPTPWHNCVAELISPNAIPKYIVAKAGIVEHSLKDGLCNGRWVEDGKGFGGRFVVDGWT